jgi:sugar/nucleoside kinase (ribokinase family)
LPRVPRLDLLTVGEGFEDLIFAGLPRLPRAGEELRCASFTPTIGGGAVITAVAAARLGLRTAVVTAVSSRAAAILESHRVRVVNVKRPHEPHAVTAALSTARDRSFVTFDGVNTQIQRRFADRIGSRPASHVHFAFMPSDCRVWAGIADGLRARGVGTSWDFGWDPSLPHRAGVDRLLRSVDYVFLNALEARLLAGRRGRAGAAFWRSATRNVVIKLGARGSRWIGQHIDVRAAAPRVRVVDTTGAGDAFNGGFIYAVLRGWPPAQCLRAANRVGARSTLAPGGIASLPSLRELTL